jgi:hypothetical protein
VNPTAAEESVSHDQPWPLPPAAVVRWPAGAARLVGDENIARDKFRRWVGAVGNMPKPRVTLTDEDTGETLTEWPEQP